MFLILKYHIVQQKSSNSVQNHSHSIIFGRFYKLRIRYLCILTIFNQNQSDNIIFAFVTLYFLQNEIEKAVLKFFSSTALLCFLIFLFYCLAYAYSIYASSPDKATLGDRHLPSANLSSSLLKMQSAITRPVKATNTALVSSNSVTNAPTAAPLIKQRIMP